MRDLKRIILHCAATREGQDFSVDTIRGWHVKGRGWSDIGYHTMNEDQEKAWRMIVLSLRTLYGDLTIHGHNEFANKACPSFIVKEKFADMY